MPRLTLLFDAGLDPRRYAVQWEQGLAPDRLPYGAEHAPDGWTFEVAARPTPGWLARPSRFLQRKLGYNLVHAYINRKALRSAEFVYCHTEVEYLGVAAILGRRGRATLAGQTIWLFRRFDGMSGWRKRHYSRLLRRVDLFVANARPNVALGAQIVPRGIHRYIPFGISRFFAIERGEPGSPDVLGVGNDIARDWDTFAAAVEALDVEVRVASKAVVRVGAEQVSAPTAGAAGLLELYRTAKVVVVAVVENAHASGITTLLEATGAGVPAIATRTGGLDDYFGDDEVTFVPEGDSEALADAIRDKLADADGSARMAVAARARQDADGYWNDVYWQHVATELLSTRRTRSDSR